MIKKVFFIISVIFCIHANAQIVNKFRDSSVFYKGVLFDSNVILTKGAASGKVLTSDAYGRATWQTFTSSGISQQTLNDSATALNNRINAKGTVTSVSAGIGMSFTTITATGAVNADTGLLTTKTYLSSILGSYASKINLNDTASALNTRINIKQNTLVSGTSIKTVNSTSLLGSGNIVTPDAQTLSIAVRTLSISGGNSVVLPSDSIKFGFNAGLDSLVFCLNDVRYAVPLNLSVYATKNNLTDTSSTLRTLISAKQANLVSGTNIKTINSGTLLGSGDISLPTATSTTTLTNKRITARYGSTTSSATPTINTDNYDTYELTAQAADITSFTANLSGTPTTDQILHIIITGTASRAITWGSAFEASTIALPTTTVGTNRLDVYFVWNSNTSKWRCGGVW